MTRLSEYLAIVALGLALVAFVISPIAHAITDSLDESAALIAATHEEY